MLMQNRSVSRTNGREIQMAATYLQVYRRFRF